MTLFDVVCEGVEAAYGCFESAEVTEVTEGTEQELTQRAQRTHRGRAEAVHEGSWAGLGPA